MPVICLDTNVIIWGVKGEYSSDQDEMVGRSKRLLRRLKEEKHTLVVPAIVLAEAMVNLPPEQHSLFLERVQKRFAISPFDAGASSQFARLWATYKDHPLAREAAANQERTRAMMKADCMIIATAMNVGAFRIYTHNIKDFKRFSVPGIDVLDIPDIVIPPVVKQEGFPL